MKKNREMRSVVRASRAKSDVSILSPLLDGYLT